jgi:molybdopterin-binding protein
MAVDAAAQVRIDIANGNRVTSTITSESANQLALEKGKAVPLSSGPAT